MKNFTPTHSLLISGILCSTFGHNFAVTTKITNHINEYKCKKCGKEVTDGFSGNIELLTFKTKKVNACLASFFQKKMRRVSTH